MPQTPAPHIASPLPNLLAAPTLLRLSPQHLKRLEQQRREEIAARDREQADAEPGAEPAGTSDDALQASVKSAPPASLGASCATSASLGDSVADSDLDGLLASLRRA